MPPHTKNIMMEAGDFSHGGLPSPHNGHGSSYEIGLDSGSTINTSSHHALQEAPPYSSHQSSTGSVNNSTPQRRRMERLKKLEERHGSTHVRRASTSGSLCGAPSHLATSGAPSNNAFEPSRIGTHVRRATTIGSLSGFRPGSNSEMGFALSRLGSSEGSCVRKVHLPNVDRVGSPCGSPSSNSNLSVVPSGTLSGATSQSGSNYSNENRHRLRLKKQSYHRRTQSEGSTVSLALAAAAASTTSAQYSTLDHSSGDAPRITVGSGGGDRDDAPVLVRKLMDSLEGRPPSSHAAAPAPAPSGPQHSQIPVQMQTRGEGDNTTSGSKQYHSQPNSPTELEHNYNGLSEKDLWALGISGHTMNPWGDLGRSKQKYRDHAKKSPSKAIPPVFQATSKSNQAMSASAKDNDDVTKHKSTSSQPLKGEGIDKASHSLLPGASTRRRYSLSEKSSVPMRRVPVNDLSVNDLSSSSRQQHYHSHHQSAGNDHALPPTAEAHPIHLEQAQTLPPPLPRPMRDQSHFDQKHPKQQKKQQHHQQQRHRQQNPETNFISPQPGPVAPQQQQQYQEPPNETGDAPEDEEDGDILPDDSNAGSPAYTTFKSDVHNSDGNTPEDLRRLWKEHSNNSSGNTQQKYHFCDHDQDNGSPAKQLSSQRTLFPKDLSPSSPNKFSFNGFVQGKYIDGDISPEILSYGGGGPSSSGRPSSRHSASLRQLNGISSPPPDRCVSLGHHRNRPSPDDSPPSTSNYSVRRRHYPVGGGDLTLSAGVIGYRRSASLLDAASSIGGPDTPLGAKSQGGFASVVTAAPPPVVGPGASTTTPGNHDSMSSVCSSSCVSSPITPVDLRQQHAESSGVNMSRDYGKGLMDEVGADNESLDENIMNRMANLDALDAPLFDDNILMKGHSSKLGVGDMIHPPPPVSPKRGRSLRGQVYQRPSNVSLETIGQLGPMNKNIADFSLGQQQEKQQHEQETFPREKRTPLYNDSHSSVPPSTVTPLVNTAMPSNQLGGNVGGPGTSAMHMPRSIESSSHRISLSTRHPSNLNFKRAIQQYNSQHSSLPFCDKNESTVVRSLSKLRGPARYQYVETDIGLGYLVDDWGPRGTDEEEVVIGCWAVPYGSIGASVKTMEALVKHRCHGSDPDEDPNGDTSVSSAVDKQQRLDLFLENEEQRLQAQADHEIQARKVREHLVQTVAAGSLEQGSTSLLLPLVVRSHSVLILDVRSEAEMTVESRKNERSRRDIWGCHDRSDALWLGTVLEFVARRIDNSMGRGAMMEWEMDRLHEEPEFGSSQNSQKRQSGERRARCGVDLLSVVIMGQSTSSSKLSEAATSSTQGAKVGSFIEAGGTEVTFDTLMPEAVEGATVLLAYEPISWSLYGRLADMRDAACPKEELPKATGVNSSSDNDYDIYDDGDESDEEEGINEGQSEEQIPVSCWTPQASKSLLAIPESVRSQMASTGGFSALGLSNRALMNSPPPPPPPKPRPDLIRPLLPSLRLAEQILARHDSHSGTLDAVAVVIASCGKHTDGVLPRSRGRKEAKGKSAGSEVMRNGAVVLEDLVGRGVALMGGSKKIGLLTSSGQSKGSKDEVEHDVKQQQSKKLTPKEIEDAAIEIITNLAKRYGRRLVVGTIAVCPAAPVVPGGVLGEQGVTFLCSIDDSLANSRLGGTRCAPSSQTLSGSMTSKKSLLSCHGGSLEETKGQDSENFSLLSHLADLAASFGCAGQFHRPPPTATDIGNAFATLEMALSDLQLETCVESLNSTLLSSIPSESMWTRPVRTVTREPCRLGHAPIPMAVENTISAFFPGDCYHIFCYPNLSRKIWDIETAQFVNVPLQFFPTAGGVAFKRAAFGENSRGYVHRCFEVAADGRTVVGSSLVAKEDRFVPQSVGQQGVVDYALMHCIEQTEAEGLARIFNRHLDGMTFLDPTVARISFVECSVYQLSNATGQTTVSVLVEPKLNPAKLNQFTVRKKSPPLDDDIVEEVERRIDSFDPWNVSLPERGSYLSVSPIEVAECFSHFTYVHSLGKSFVCDLQGEYDADSSMFRLTDPTIYSYEVPKASSGKRAMAFQNVDRNKRALNDFFHSHECGPLCRHVLKEYLKPPPKIPEGTNANRGSAPKKCGWEGRGEGVEDYFPTCVPVSTGGRGGFYNKWIPSLKIPRSFESASSSLAKMLSRGMDDASAVKEVTLDTLQSMCGPGDIR